jgi:hypothetical protein
MKNTVLKKITPLKAKAIKDVRTAIENRNKGIVLTSNNFIVFAKNNADKFMRAVETFAKAVAPSMKNADKRFMIGELSLFILRNEFPNDLSVPDGSQKGFDMLYRTNGVKVSIKSGIKVFQKSRKNGKGLTNPPSIMLKNGMGHREISNPVFDYLLVIQRDYNSKEGRYEYGYGIVDKHTALEYSAPSKKGDQVISRIPNDAYNYFSGIHFTVGEDKGDKKDAIINGGQFLINTALTAIV